MSLILMVPLALLTSLEVLVHLSTPTLVLLASWLSLPPLVQIPNLLLLMRRASQSWLSQTIQESIP